MNEAYQKITLCVVQKIDRIKTSNPGNIMAQSFNVDEFNKMNED